VLPDGYGTRGSLWTCYSECGLYESALRIAREEVAVHPQESRAHSRFAWSLAHAGQLDAALDQAAHAISIDENNHINWKILGRIHAARGSFRDALEALKHGRADAETSVLASFLYAAAADDEVRDGRKAVRIHVATSRVFPNPVPPHLSLVGGCCYAEAGDFEKAVALAKAALTQSLDGSPIEASAEHLLTLFENRKPYRLDRDRTLRPFDLPVLEHIIPLSKPAAAADK
jgi:tetratricopeptide (TPR) repeat protein